MNEEDPEVPATGCSSRGAGAILSPPSGPHQGRYDIPLGFLDPLPTATTVAALLGGSSSGSPELFSDTVPPRSDSPTIPPPSAETRPSAQGGRLDGAIMDDGKTATTPHPMVRSSESTLTTNGACWSSGEHNGMPLSSMTERGAVLVSISIPNAPDGASLNASVDPGTNAACSGGTATGSSTDAVELTSISAVALGAEKGSHERLRLLLLDHADREAAFYPNDHAARRRVAVLHASVMSHNDRVQANLRRFFQYSAETGAAATPPQTDKFVPIGVPPHFIDPVTHRMMGDPVVFLDKRIVDRSVAEALVFRLFSTMIRCNAVGTTKRREFFTYCLERVLISTVAKQWSREVFGFHGLQMTPRRDIALATEQWLLGVLALHKDVRDTVENTIRDELGMPPCDDTGSSVDPPGTVIVLGTATIAIGEFASTPLSSLERAVGDKHPRAWDTLEHMWRDACKLAVRGRKKQSSTTGMKKPRPSNLEALAATAAAARRRCSTSREQSNDRGPSTPVKRTPSAGGDDNNAATPSGWQCMPSIDIGIGIADSASSDVVQAIVKALVAEESTVRVGLEATILTESAALETHVAAQMEDAVRAMRPQRRRVSTTSSSNVRPSTTGGKPSSTPRPASPPLAGGLAPDPRRMPEKKLHHAVRHRVLSEAGSNHRAPHRPGQLSGVFSCASMHPPPTASGGGIDPLTALMPPHQGIEGIDSALAIQPPLCNTIAPNDVASAETKDSPLAAASVDQPNLLQALDSLTGVAECVRVPRKMEEIHVPRESGHPVVSLEEISLVSAAMRFHQDHELFDLVFDFNEKWFLDLEHRSMKWAEAQFNNMAEQEALQRTLGTRKLQHQRAVLRPHTCVVARQPRQPPPSTAAIAPPRSKRRSERRLTHGGSQDCAQPQSTAVPPCATAADMQDNDIVDRLEGNCEPVDGENAVGEHEAVGTTELPEADAMQATDAPQAPSLQSTPRVTPAPCTSASGIQPSSGWRQRIPYAGVGTCHEQLARAATKPPPPPPRPTLHPDVAVAMAMKAVDGPLSYMIPDLATNYVPLKPAWVGNPRHASCRPKPSPSSRFVDDDYIAPPDNEEFPTDHLLRELEAMYVSYDEGNVRKDVLRKRELGPYFFEPIVYAEEVARKAKEREDCVAQQIAKVTNKQLKAHWDAPTVVDQTSSIDGGVGRDHGAPLNLSPRTTHYPKVPLRPLSSTVSARHWLAAVQQPTGGKASPIARRTSTASAASARRAVDAPSGVVEGIAKTYAARFDSCAPFLPKVAGREK